MYLFEQDVCIYCLGSLASIIVYLKEVVRHLQAASQCRLRALQPDSHLICIYTNMLANANMLAKTKMLATTSMLARPSLVGEHEHVGGMVPKYITK